MYKKLPYIAAFAVLFLISPAVFAQSSKTTAKKFEGVWQVSMQKTPIGSNKFLPPYTNDLKIFDANGNFRHIIYRKDRYVELSRGKIAVTSDSTYTELLEKHLALPPSVKEEGKVVFKFLDNDTFLMKWTLNESNGEEVYERVR